MVIRHILVELLYRTEKKSTVKLIVMCEVLKI